MPNNKIEEKNIRISPHSSDAEEAVLGCMLINSESVSKAVQILDSDSFYNKVNSIIFENMKELFDLVRTNPHTSAPRLTNFFAIFPPTKPLIPVIRTFLLFQKFTIYLYFLKYC